MQPCVKSVQNYLTLKQNRKPLILSICLGILDNVLKSHIRSQNYEDFEQGQDFYEGRNVNHEIVYENLNYEQFRWDNRSINYYIDDSGNLVARINEGYTYPTGV